LKLVGCFAVFFETDTPDSFRDPEVRAQIARDLVEKAFPGLWDSLLGEGVLVARAGPRLPAGKGYAGLGLCSAHPDLFRLVTVALASGLSTRLSGEWGSAVLVRIGADPRTHPFARQLCLEAPVSPAPLEEPLTLISRSPLRKPFEILGELREAAADLARLTGCEAFLPPSELPSWNFHSYEVKPTRGGNDLVNLRLTISSWHPFGRMILDYAILKGFGKDREKGYGHLDLAESGRWGKA